MQIQITGRHLEVTPALKQYVDEKLSKLDNHFDHIIAARVILSVEKGKQMAEAVINVPGTEFVAKSDSQDMYATIDMLQDKLDAQVRKHKQKLKDHRAERPEAEALMADDEVVDIDEER
ncbi:MULTISPECIES: ribosome hibernation-promoting factor, HPF/YfiA family [Cysteiniphilum]|jgi:putative sigma-54 modulation protein|uniref:Ribosome hibernation promoting factor n=1 Tax=Cysteiniphilum litorale TaxID=2056700 RepID=A0A8J2Z4Z6_9GAMM|nr:MULTISPECIES: ribosome-associated translation inhibitor RaiA [Cysteiniphilum]MDA0911419.1 ribosome-associated translation inhibitor RaiA [Pseudomonadota bacterium]WHN66281.1 ribosome-associated translation inhibitor RaiA [Cysteiniphilum sp. QT6929]GGF99999.1 ribosomal subunit interface protein [Cysteiniphilum litorale]